MSLPPVIRDAIRLLFLAVLEHQYVVLFFVVAIEEAGVPLPAPTDVAIAFYGYRARGNLPELAQVVLVCALASTAGTLVPYLLARRFGPTVAHRLAAWIDVDPVQVDRWAGRIHRRGFNPVRVRRPVPRPRGNRRARPRARALAARGSRARVPRRRPARTGHARRGRDRVRRPSRPRRPALGRATADSEPRHARARPARDPHPLIRVDRGDLRLPRLDDPHRSARDHRHDPRRVPVTPGLARAPRFIARGRSPRARRRNRAARAAFVSGD